MSLRNVIAQAIVRVAIAHGEEFFPNPYADAILALDEFRTMQDDASKWRSITPTDIVINEMRARKLDLLMAGKVVEEKCNEEDHYANIIDSWQDNPLCPSCHGTGKITRPARPEEVAELLDALKLTCLSGKYHFTLKSGGILKMEEK